MAAILSWMKDTREFLTPQMTQSHFLERGMLTPEEFVQAGDNLVQTCPTWRWCAGEPSKRRPYLPAEKQYLTTENVNCYKRIAFLERNTVDVEIADETGDENEGWCAPEVRVPKDGDREVGDEDDAVIISASDLSAAELSLGDKEEEPAAAPAEETKKFGEFDFEDESLSIDAYAVAASEGGGKSSSNEDEIIHCRKYDLSITYDNYYRTPRIWLFGYDENGSVLNQHQVFEDIMGDYARKTVTFEAHPHESRPQATVHPCQHATTMLRLINSMSDAGKVPTVDQYMFIFLKFVQSVIPAIEYDFTSDINTGRT